jgi:hypothetical protein
MSVRDALLITFWAAVFCANWVLFRSSSYYRSDFLAGWAVIFLLVTPPAAIVGAIAGRRLTGLVCGIASTVAVMAWSWLDRIYPM